MISFLSSFLYIFPDSKIMFSTCQKAKSCPQPAEKQKWYHNPQKTKSSISYREQKKGSLQPRRVMTPDRGNPLKQGFSSLPLGKIAELALGYGGSVGALKSMGALEMGLTEEELHPLVNSWRNSNPMITAFWWEIDRAVKTTITQRIQTEVRRIRFFYKSGILFIKLPSGRLLSYVKPRIGENQYGGESVTYEGVGSTKK